MIWDTFHTKEVVIIYVTPEAEELHFHTLKTGIPVEEGESFPSWDTIRDGFYSESYFPQQMKKRCTG